MNGPKVVTATFGLPFSKCDVNEDTHFTADDVVAAAKEALLITTQTHDVNGTGGMNILDIQIAVNAGINQSCPVQ